MWTLLAALIIQTKELEPIVVPPASSEAFQSTVFAIQEAVDAGNWPEAVRLSKRLPSLDLTVTWDESGLNADQKKAFAAARDTGVEVWTKGIEGLKVTFVPKGRLKIGFVPELPPNIDSPGPAGAVFFDSPADDEPVLEAVWALVRTEEKRLLTTLDVRNETVFAIGAALGLARQPRPTSVLFRTEGSYFHQTAWTLSEARLTKAILAVADRIRKEVAERKNPQIGAPKIVYNPAKFEPTPVGQAEPMLLSLQISNQGKGTLDYRLVPDCGCFVLGPHQQVLAPGETTVVDIAINTFEFTGKLNKYLFVYSNDPEAPVRKIMLDTIVRPAYRFVGRDDPVLYVDENGAIFETTLVVEAATPFNIKKVSIAGVSGAVDYKPWEGELDWPDIGEGKKKRKGFAIKALVAPGIPAGRTPMQIQVETDSPFYKTLVTTVNVQKGIATVPLSVYFGQIEQKASTATVVLTRPGKPFKVTKVVSDTQFVTVSFEPYRDGSEYRIIARFTGDAPPGRFAGKITVHTDDAKQPLITIPVEGTVR